MSLLKKVEKTIEKYKLLQKNDKVVVAVSGGVDSLALLHCLYRLKETYSLTLVVAHLNHMFRGEEADEDAETVKKLAIDLGLGAVIGKVDVPQIIRATLLSPQDAARKARYEFLQQAANSIKANKIALGHHQDDQAETVLLHLCKGAGLDGLKGIMPKRDIYIRPLLAIQKWELEKYCRDHKLPVRVDKSNYKDVYLRNKIRNRLIPWLKQEVNANIIEVLAGTAEILRDENQYLEEEIGHLEQKIRVSLSFKQQKGVWDTRFFCELPKALQRRLIRRVYLLVSGHRYNLTFMHIEAVRHTILNKISGSKVELPGKLLAVYAYDRLELMPKELFYSKRNADYSYELPIPGRIAVKEAGSIIESKLMEPGQKINNLEVDGKEEVLVKLEAGDALIVRNRKSGDRFQPVGMLGTKKLKDFFIDEKVDRKQRDIIPVVVSKNSGKIVWIAGMRSSEEFKFRPGMEAVLLRIYKVRS
ncbi:MAG: tRNA lysidine(34) synthetase TilS [Bacillota bacterium]